MRKIVSLAVRRDRAARTHAARVRYARIYTGAGATVIEMPRPVVHETSVTPVEGGKFVPVCTCGETLGRPMTERGAKGVGTRHRNAVAPVAA